ncbi:MAG TPA: tetratricopeptide repeat protein [Bryobacteraceae bacterium]|jgi:Tfp pilus assembly protein PilF|nr:tetratricopeptide repeat protein [Bryobacteraceae bacterium]
MTNARAEMARELFQNGYQLQMQGEFDLAAQFYQRSIELHPTAEAHTFLGWTYHYQGKVDEAIEECKKAIAVDPTFGNPYNDIGAYLIERDEHQQAIPWLEQAIASKRYEAYHYPWYNLGRVYVAQEIYNKARQCFQKSLEIEPGYTLAEEALKKLKLLLQ